LRFGTSSYLVGACSGRSADFSPPDVVKVARCAPELMGHMRAVGYLFLVADCALRSACSAHAIHAAAISINIALSFSDARCAKRRHSAAYCRKRSASLSMTRSTFWVCSNVPSCLGVFPNVPSCKPGTLRIVPVQINFADGTKAAIRRSSRALTWGWREGRVTYGEA